MTNRVEAAYARLHGMLKQASEASDACPDGMYRNASVTVLVRESRTGVEGVLNLLDSDGRVMGQITDEEGADCFELLQPAILEVIVLDPDQDRRESRFSAIMSFWAEYFRGIDSTLGGLVDDCQVTDAPERFVIQQVNGAKGARIRIDILLTAPTPLG
ncbi:hypothetical protein [Hyphomonas pacifica]|uniref:Uncharacterized protein n=1 Tax=Hyphomonas pacifica TaxID=1280941 RepID=A0A8B2PFP5_9PROT|nr:hypothetical protein [Hyphomonas pacifica]RAN30635.1 hypothetical protein HY3_05655 [Hyphomonas pacifica]